MKKNAVLAALAVALLVVLGMYAVKNLNGNTTASTPGTPLISAPTVSSEKTTPAEESKTPAADSTAPATGGDQVVAKYKGASLTKAEVNEKIKEMSGGKMPEGKTDIEQFPKEVQQNIIKGIITGRLVSAEAAKLDLQNDPKVVKTLSTIKEQVVQQEFITRKIKESVTEQALKARYDEFVKEESNKEETKARHILVETEDQAKKIAEELKKGAKFEDLAKQHSKDSNKDKGGDLGYFRQGQMVKEFETAALALKVGEISAPVKTDFGYHIIKVEDRRKVTAPSFDEVKAKLDQELGQKAAQAYIEGIQKDANIEILLK